MARTVRSLLSSSRMLVVVSCLMAVLALLPSRAIRWLDQLSEKVTLLLAPVQRPLAGAVRLFAGGPRGPSAETPEMTEARQRADEYKFLWLNEREENQRLHRQISELQKGLALNPEMARPVFAPIIGEGIDLSPGLLKAKAGEREGIIPGSVAVVEGVQLVGRVTKVESRYCLIHPITQVARAASGSKEPQRIGGVIMFSNGERGPVCDLVPAGNGLLNGPLLAQGTDALPMNRLREAMERHELEVRLDDQEWPSSAQMLIIGEVVEITPRPQQPLRPVVSVRPKFKIENVSEVVIRVPLEVRPGGGP